MFWKIKMKVKIKSCCYLKDCYIFFSDISEEESEKKSALYYNFKYNFKKN